MHNDIGQKTRRVEPETTCNAAEIGNSAPVGERPIDFLKEMLQPPRAANRIRAWSLHCITNSHKPTLQPNPRVGGEIKGAEAALGGQ
jgi:hypothetical protein